MSNGTPSPCPCGTPQDPQVVTNPPGLVADLLPGRRLHRLPPGAAAPAARRAGDRPLAARAGRPRPADTRMVGLPRRHPHLLQRAHRERELPAHRHAARAASPTWWRCSATSRPRHRRHRARWPRCGRRRTPTSHWSSRRACRCPASPLRASRRRPSRSPPPRASPGRRASRSRSPPDTTLRRQRRRHAAVCPAGRPGERRQAPATGSCWPSAGFAGPDDNWSLVTVAVSRRRPTREPARSTPGSRSPPARGGRRPATPLPGPSPPAVTGCCARPPRPRSVERRPRPHQPARRSVGARPAQDPHRQPVGRGPRRSHRATWCCSMAVPGRHRPSPASPRPWKCSGPFPTPSLPGVSPAEPAGHRRRAHGARRRDRGLPPRWTDTDPATVTVRYGVRDVGTIIAVPAATLRASRRRSR